MNDDIWELSDDENQAHSGLEAGNASRNRDLDQDTFARSSTARSRHYERKMAEREWSKLHRVHGVVGWNPEPLGRKMEL